MRLILIPIAVAVLACIAGCGDGLNRAAVSGIVSVDKEPLPEGSINFFPDNGPSVGAIIKDGSYSIPVGKGVIVGKNRVEINGFRKSGKKVQDIWDKSKMLDELVIAVPPEYNEKSTLIREIKSGVSKLDFELSGFKK